MTWIGLERDILEEFCEASAPGKELRERMIVRYQTYMDEKEKSRKEEFTKRHPEKQAEYNHAYREREGDNYLRLRREAYASRRQPTKGERVAELLRSGTTDTSTIMATLGVSEMTVVRAKKAETTAGQRMHLMRGGYLVPSCKCEPLDFRDDGKALCCERCRAPALPRVDNV